MTRHRPPTVFLAAIVSLASLACGAGTGNIELGPVDKGPGTVAAARKHLEGRWTLVSFEITTVDGVATAVPGTGLLTFDEYGNLTTEIRVDEPAARTLEANGIRTTNGTLRTSGRAVVDMQARTLTYVIEGERPLGAPSDPLALNRPRHWQVDGAMLTLTTKADNGNPVSVGRWRKM